MKGKTGGEVAQLRRLPSDAYSWNLVRHTYQVRQRLQQIVEMALGVDPAGKCQSQ